MLLTQIVRADLADPRHAAHVLDLIDMYARDPMGGGEPLHPTVKARLIEGLRAHPTTMILLAYHDGTPVGVAVCFLGYSTFRAAPLMNIHDLAVAPAARGLGVGRTLLAAVETEAKARGCCKVTLEVLARNGPARRVYTTAGFRGAGEADGESTFFCTRQL